MTTPTKCYRYKIYRYITKADYPDNPTFKYYYPGNNNGVCDDNNQFLKRYANESNISTQINVGHWYHEINNVTPIGINLTQSLVVTEPTYAMIDNYVTLIAQVFNETDDVKNTNIDIFNLAKATGTTSKIQYLDLDDNSFKFAELPIYEVSLYAVYKQNTGLYVFTTDWERVLTPSTVHADSGVSKFTSTDGSINLAGWVSFNAVRNPTNSVMQTYQDWAIIDITHDSYKLYVDPDISVSIGKKSDTNVNPTTVNLGWHYTKTSTLYTPTHWIKSSYPISDWILNSVSIQHSIQEANIFTDRQIMLTCSLAYSIDNESFAQVLIVDADNNFIAYGDEITIHIDYEVDDTNNAGYKVTDYYISNQDATKLYIVKGTNRDSGFDPMINLAYKLESY